MIDDSIQLAASVEPTTAKANATSILRDPTHATVELRSRGDRARLGSGRAI